MSCIEVDGDRIVGGDAGRRPPDDAYRARRPHAPRARQRALARLPARAARAHARAARGRSGPGASRCTSWPATLDPDSCFALARAAFGEMALAGITCVGEFHYLHHAPDGTPVRRPERDGPRRARRGAGGRAADHAARRLLPARRHRALPRPRRAPRWAERVDAARRARAGAGRRRDPQRARGRPGRGAGRRRVGRRQAAARARLRAAEGERGLPRRPRPHADRAARRRRRARRELHRDPRHAPDRRGRRAARRRGATVCLCPTTERDLADGIGPARRLADAGAALATGSDSHAVIDPFEEARAIELDERLATGVRGAHRAPDLLAAATAGGYAALGWPEGGPPRAGRAGRPHDALARLRAPGGHRARARCRERGVRRDRRRRPRRDGRRRLDRPRRPPHGVRRRRPRCARRWHEVRRRRQHRAARHQRPERSARARSASSATPRW